MSTSENLVFGQDDNIDELLEKLLEAMPTGFDDDPLSMVAALLTLDEHYGLRQEGDYVLMPPAMMWLMAMVQPVDPALKQALEQEDDAVINRLTVDQPFEVECSSPEGPEYTAQYSEIVRGKRIRLRVMSEAQSSQLDDIYTVRQDGTFIYLPSRTRPARLDDLTD
jgi:hypothetical protein